MNKFVESIVKGVIVAGISGCAAIAISAVEKMQLHHGQDNELSDNSDEETETVWVRLNNYAENFEKTEEA